MALFIIMANIVVNIYSQTAVKMMRHVVNVKIRSHKAQNRPNIPVFKRTDLQTLKEEEIEKNVRLRARAPKGREH